MFIFCVLGFNVKTLDWNAIHHFSDFRNPLIPFIYHRMNFKKAILQSFIRRILRNTTKTTRASPRSFNQLEIPHHPAIHPRNHSFTPADSFTDTHIHSESNRHVVEVNTEDLPAKRWPFSPARRKWSDIAGRNSASIRNAHDQWPGCNKGN